MRSLMFSAVFALVTTTANALEIGDGDFTAWSSFFVVKDDPFVAAPGPGSSGGTGTRRSTGGNSDAFFGVSHTLSPGDAVSTGGLKDDFTYLPSALGAIQSIDIEADVKSLPLGAYGWQVVISQSGNLYFSVPIGAFTYDQFDPSWERVALITNDAPWTHVVRRTLRAVDFSADPWDLAAGNVGFGSHPDFGANSAPLTFGFAFGNRVLGNATLTNNLGLDNFKLTITPVPEPSSSVLAITGLVLLITIHRGKRPLKRRRAVD